MKNKTNDKLFKFCRFAFRLMGRRFISKYVGEINTPAVYIVHHQNLKGPILTMAWCNNRIRLWVLSVFCSRQACFQQYYNYTFTKRFGLPKTLSAAIALPLSIFVSSLMKSMRAIPVFRGSRAILKTFRQSLTALLCGENVLICPDIEYTDKSPDIGEIYDGFLNLERFYLKKTGKHLAFVPVHINKTEHIICFGNAVYFSTALNFKQSDFKQEKLNVYNRLMQEFSHLEKYV